jgi:hypothetical protein
MQANGRIESGMIANMRTYLLPYEAKIHTRILGESRTLCGRSLFHNNQYAWQFINTGNFSEGHMPSGSNDPRRACSRCSRSLVLQVTKTISDARSAALRLPPRSRRRTA